MKNEDFPLKKSHFSDFFNEKVVEDFFDYCYAYENINITTTSLLYFLIYL